MKDRKFRPEGSLQFYDYERIERHLAQMAAKGWRLERISGLGWHYRRAPAKKLTYAVEYFEEGSDFNAGLPNSQQEFVEYCEAAGWQLVTTWAQMMIFVSEEENPTPIETEPATRLETIARSMKRNYLPGSIVMIALGLLEVGLQLPKLFRDPVGFWSGAGLYAGLCWLLVAVMFACRTGHYLVWLRRSRRAVDAGGDCLPMHTGWIAAVDRIVLIGEIVLLAGICARLGARWLGCMTVLMAGFYLNMLLTWRLRDFLRARNAGAWTNRLITIGFCAVFAFALTGGMVWYALTAW